MKIAKLQITSDLNVDLEMAIDQNKPWHASETLYSLAKIRSLTYFSV